MYNRRFFGSKLGQAALVSIAAMMTFTILSTVHAAPVGDIKFAGMAGTDLA